MDAITTCGTGNTVSQVESEVVMQKKTSWKRKTRPGASEGPRLEWKVSQKRKGEELKGNVRKKGREEVNMAVENSDGLEFLAVAGEQPCLEP